MNDINAAFLYANLVERLKTANQGVRERIETHIRIVTGELNLDAYHKSGASEQQKTELYSECLKAILKADFRQLKGEGATPAETGAETDQGAIGCSDTLQATKIAVEAKNAGVNDKAGLSADDPVLKIAALLRDLLPKPEPKLDEVRLRHLITEILSERMRHERVLIVELIHRIISEKLVFSISVKKD